MINSMTGYGSATFYNAEYTIEINIKSLNSKYLDVHVNSPGEIEYLDNKILNYINNFLSRGKINIKISIDFKNKSKLFIDYDKADQVYQALLSLDSRYNLGGDISIDNILVHRDIIMEKSEDIDKANLEEYIFETLASSVKDLLKYRKDEGVKLYEDLSIRLDDLEKSVSKIEDRSFTVKDDYKLSLENKLSQISDLDEDYLDKRLASEIIIIAEKSDISEEITRLKSHTNLFRNTLEDNKASGKKLDFICQEFLREVNTISSKASDIDIINEVISMKTLIDQIREQVQNIE